MSKNYDELDQVFDVSSTEIENTPVETIKEEKIEKVSSQVDHVKKDYEYTRGNLYSLIEKGQEALNGVLELAQESDSPRAYEVVGQMIKSVGDTTDKLVDLQKKVKELDEVQQTGPTNVTNALFVGSTAELSKLIKAQKKQDDK